MYTQALWCRRFISLVISLATTATVGMGGGSAPALLGSVPTASAAQTIGINGSTVYTCDNNEISIINVANPASPAVLGTAVQPGSTTNNFCDVQRGSLVQMIDGSPPSFITYDITNAASPKPVGSTTVNKKFFGPPYYQANQAFFGTNEIVFGSGYPGPVTDQAGDFVSMDVTSLMAPVVQGATETQTHGPIYGGSFNVYGAIPYNGQLAYVTATTSQANATQTGIGQLWVVNTANPSAMSIVTRVNVPGTLQVFGPLIQNNTAVTIGDSLGWRQPCCGSDAFTGNVVITVYDVTNPQSPQIVANVTTTYVPGPAIGRGAAVIGPHLFLYAGVIDANNNNYFMLVDTTDPKNPVITTSPTSASINYLRAVGTMLYAPADSGLQIYSISANTPAITLVANAFGDTPLIAPNTWVEIKGTNLSPPGDSRIWQGSDFANNQLPVQLDGVSVTVNGKPAYVYFISAAQINILTTPDSLPTSVQVQVSVGGAQSNVATVAAQPQSLSFFEFVSSGGLAYIYGRHSSDNSLIGPPGLFPAAPNITTPVKPGESIYVAGNGFGQTNVPVISGALTQSGDLPMPFPVVKIGGIQAQVSFAGLIADGTYQFNLTVPNDVPDGDQPLTATYSGLSIQPNLLITVHR